MMPIQREAEPEISAEMSAVWTRRYLDRLNSYEAKLTSWSAEKQGKRPKKPKFSWPRHKSKPLNQHLMPVLLFMTRNHCSYCDGFPMGVMTTRTIDHFKPKEAFPEEAYSWSNLFACCNACQDAKGTQTSPSLLKPDDVDYAFSRYFLFNYRTGEIEINPFATQGEQTRARITLDILDLNNAGVDLPGARQRAYENHDPDRPRPIEERPYRFMFSLETG
ncbi:MAG: TIGR02646 family protein [Acidobacteriota bacterium]|nr:TIGR02646 family protein [Acidobacteriota bacterium]